MILISAEVRAPLIANGAAGRGGDPIPVLKIFNPIGPERRLVAELADDGDTLFGIAELGFGYPDTGAFSLSELVRVRLELGLASKATSIFKLCFRCPSIERRQGKPAASYRQSG